MTEIPEWNYTHDVGYPPDGELVIILLKDGTRRLIRWNMPAVLMWTNPARTGWYHPADVVAWRRPTEPLEDTDV